MASVFQKAGRTGWYCRVKGDKVPGKWSDAPCEDCTTREEAVRYANAAQKAIDKRRGVLRPGQITFREWVKHWLVLRQEAGYDWKKDRGRLDNHVLPAIGGLELSEVTSSHLAELVHALRFRVKLGNRTVRNIYSVIAAAFRDARIHGKVQQTPCILTDAQLGPVIDKDPEWRASALFTRSEAAVMVNDERIPLDRRVVYGLGLLAGLRIGEGAALRWRHYDADRKPLGMLTVALAYSTSHSRAKGTKTNAVRYVPVHPVLAVVLDTWRTKGYASMFGRDPDLDDLVVPLPPDVKRTSRTGDPYRGWDYTGRRWREVDLPAVGWRARSVYDSRATFITLALEDGADPVVIRERVTHAKSRRDAFSGYDRGAHWEQTCREVAKLSIPPLADAVLTKESKPVKSKKKSLLRRRVSNRLSGPPQLTVIQGGREVIPAPCDHAMAVLSATCGRPDIEAPPHARTGAR